MIFLAFIIFYCQIKMGAVKSFIESLDAQKEQEAAAKEAVEIALEMVRVRFHAFEAEINIPVGPIQKVRSQYLISFSKKIAVNVNKDSGPISNEISNIVDSFVSGNIKQGICNILHSTLDAILGSYSAGYNESQNYLIVVNQMGGIYRIDYLVVQQRMVSKGITTKCQDVFGSYLIISSIEKGKIVDDNVYRIIIDRQFVSKKSHQKFLLLKLVKGEQLTPAEYEEIENMDVEPQPRNLMFLTSPTPFVPAVEEVRASSRVGNLRNGEVGSGETERRLRKRIAEDQ